MNVDRTELVGGIADTLQRAYGDATQTVLDRQAAQQILEYIEGRMVPVSTLAAVIAAAGGRVAVPPHLQLDPPHEVHRIDDPSGEVVLCARAPVR